MTFYNNKISEVISHDGFHYVYNGCTKIYLYIILYYILDKL